MTKKLFDVDEAILAEAQRQLGTTTGEETVNVALATVAGLKVKEREAALDYLREHFDELFNLSAVDPGTPQSGKSWSHSPPHITD